MELREFFTEDAINLDLKGESKDEILKELIALLGLDEKSEGILFKMLKRRENLGSTGIGRGIAIPHCRSLVVNRLRVAFGRKSEGVEFKAIDEKPGNFFFPFVALRNRKKGYAVSIIKAGLHVLGKDPGPVRPPLTDLTPEELAALAKIIDTAKAA